MDNVHCSGTELSLVACDHYTMDDCSYSEGAGVVCFNIALLGGATPNEGNLFVNGKAVCDDSWDDVDAGVACRTLG